MPINFTATVVQNVNYYLQQSFDKIDSIYNDLDTKNLFEIEYEEEIL